MSGLGLRSPAFVGILTASGGASVPSAPVLTGVFNNTDEGFTLYDLSWTTPSNNGSAITVYKVDVSSNNITWTTSSTTSSNTESVGLFQGTTRYYRVIAVNAIGDGPPSNVLTITG